MLKKLRPRFSLAALLLTMAGIGLFLWWARFETLEVFNTHRVHPLQARHRFYWCWRPRGFENVSSYHWYGDTVHLQIWPKCCKYPFALVEGQSGVWFIQWPTLKGSKPGPNTVISNGDDTVHDYWYEASGQTWAEQ